MTARPTHHLRWLIWCLAALFYFYEFVLRVSPQVLVNNLMHSFGIGAGAVGVISAFYLYSYAPMQLPVGMLIDRYGIKKLLSVASVVCGSGAVLFSLSIGVVTASIGRFCIGLGSAFAFVSMVYITTHWFGAKRRALLIGLANSIAMLGASCGGGPLASLISAVGWRHAIMGIGFFGIMLAGAIYWSLREDADDLRIEKETAFKRTRMLSSLKVVFTSWRSWINGLVAICFYLTTTVFAGLWGVPFIESAHGVTKTVASYAISMVFVGWLVGGPIIGLVSDTLGKRVAILRIAMLLCLCALSAVVYITQIPLWAVYVLTFLVGLFSSGELLNFTVSIELNPLFVKATAVAFTNFLVSVGDGIAQPVTGFFLDMFWKGKVIDGIPYYTTQDYQHALTLLPILLIIGFFLSFILKDREEVQV